MVGEVNEDEFVEAMAQFIWNNRVDLACVLRGEGAKNENEG